MQIKIIDNIQKIVLIAVLLSTCLAAGAQLTAHFPMDIIDNKITESITGKTFAVVGNFTPENIAGADGMAWRTDGYTNFVDAAIDVDGLTGEQLTFSLWLAVETYPMMVTDAFEHQRTMVAGNINDASKSGFAFTLSNGGEYAFEGYAGGWKVECKANSLLEKYTWNHLTAVVDTKAGSVRLYCNGVEKGSASCNQALTIGNSRFMIGRAFEERFSGPFRTNTINGLIDDIRIFNSAETPITAGYRTADAVADLSIPASRFENDLLRPRFHGMPGANWTNETHGLIHYNGRFHAFFQKNANGPYMARLHWGHISSENLYLWKEEKIAIAPGAPYDIKGCWSGCVYQDDELTDGEPHIFYTAVDNGKAMIAEARPLDDDLITWEKVDNNPIIDGRPQGLSDDFRDCFIFKSGNEHYMFVGTSKNGLGACTLHRFDGQRWSNDGKMFFENKQPTNGTFFEMSTVFPIGDKWVFTATPLGASGGVKVLYWVGGINNEGEFVSDVSWTTYPQTLELSGMAREGFGLLSPSVMQYKGKTIIIGIVPDKLPGNDNYRLGWAHTYSLPRELSLDEYGCLVQKPFSGLQSMRTETLFAQQDVQLNGTLSLLPVEGRKVEVSGTFVIGSAERFGFQLYKNSNRAVELYYEPATNTVGVDMSKMPRLRNDGGVFDGVYRSRLPRPLGAGNEVTIHAYIDHSIMDIFINEQWAFSVRVFPTDVQANGVEAFSHNGTTEVRNLEAWVLDETLPLQDEHVGVEAVEQNDHRIFAANGALHYQDIVSGSNLVVYDTVGRVCVERRISGAGSIAFPYSGLYIACVEDAQQVSSYKLFIE